LEAKKYLKYLSIFITFTGFLLLLPYHLQNDGLMYGYDDESYFAHASSIAFFQFPSYKKESYRVGDTMPKHSIGPGIMAAPFVFIFSQIDRIQKSPIIEKRTKQVIKKSWALFGFDIATLIYFCLACFLLYYGLNYYFDPKISFLSVSFMILIQGFPLFVFRRPVFSHTYEFFLQSLLIYILLRDYKSPFIKNLKIKFSILLGLVISLIFLVRYNNILIAALWPLVIFRVNSYCSFTEKLKDLIIVYATFIIMIFLFKFLPIIYNQYPSVPMKVRHLPLEKLV